MNYKSGVVNKTRISSLDALRGIAALAVVLYHYTFRYDAVYGHAFSLDSVSALKYGYLGVQLFFMVSGFVIYLSLENTSNVKKFVFNRFSRLYPAYWFAVILTFLAVLIFSLPGRDVSFLEMLTNLTMLNGFIGMPSVDGVYWTLRVELTFYFIISSLYFLMPKKQLLISFLCVSSSIFIVKCFDASDHINFIFKLANFVFSLEYLHFFGAGIGFYLLFNKENYILALLLITVSVVYTLTFKNGGVLFVTLSFYPIFFLLSSGRAEFLSTSLLTYLGAISYSLYLVHQNLGYIVFNYAYKYNINPFVAFFIALFISILISHFMTNYIEKVLGKKLKKRLNTYA